MRLQAPSNANLPIISNRLVPSKSDLTALKNFQRLFVITVVDKASNNFCIVCKKHYIQRCKSELENSNAYSPSNLDMQGIKQDGKSRLNAFF